MPSMAHPALGTSCAVVLVAWPAGNVLVSRPVEERGLKPSLATTHAKASERVIADPLGWEDTLISNILVLVMRCSKLESPGLEHLFRELKDGKIKGTSLLGISSQSPLDPSQRKFLSLESTERGIASMSAVDKA